MRQKDGFLEDVELHQLIQQCIETGHYRFTKHAAEEQAKDSIDIQDTLYVLTTGTHNRKKTGFDNHHQMWKYAIEGKAEDRREVRVIVAITKDMLIITVMEL